MLSMHRTIKRIMLLIFIGALFDGLFADDVTKATLTRGKMWICALPNGAFEREDGMGQNWLNLYPGYFGSRNPCFGGWDDTRIFNVAQINGENVGWEWRNQRTNSEIFPIEQTELVNNYNLVNPGEPEQYMRGVMGSYKLDGQNKRHMSYSLEARMMVWSLPEYDDFILVKCKLTNTDDAAFEDFYYARLLQMNGPLTPLGTSYDVEYLWDSEVSEEIGFIFYDDTTWPPTSDSTRYMYSPGDVTGDRGDPGNIRIANSTDKKLYSPYLTAATFLSRGLTPNKYNEKKVWRRIVSTSSAAPSEERYPGSEVMATFAGLQDFITTEQPKMSWRDAYRQYQPGNMAGSRYERSPRYVYAIGPYDIPPGGSIEWIELFIAGQMDRNITLLGGLEATSQFVAKGLEHLKENWTAASELVENDFRVVKDVPPPTPADAPRIGNENELLVEPAMSYVDNVPTSGVNITCKAVHLAYKDPLTGEPDFAGYNVYRSDISVEGPWILVKTISLAEVDPLVTNDKVTFFLQVPVGIPYRYCVTSYDRYGNESAMTGYNHHTVTAVILPSNRLSDVRVVPNPFRQQSGFRDLGEKKRIAFVNIPEKCTIRIYTMAMDLVRKIEHNGGGEATWGSTAGKDYMLTDFAMNVAPGVYIYHIESHVEGYKGENTVGKLVIIK